jgi:hypothetical protein
MDNSNEDYKRSIAQSQTSILRIRGKKGIDQWISWTLLLVFSVLLASIVAYWMKDYIAGTSGDMVKRSHITEYCDGVGIEIQDLVAKNSQTLNMKVVNTYNLAINKIIFRVYDADNNILINMTNVTIKPGQNKTVEISKNETIAFIEAVPVILDGGEEIICKDKIVFKNITG